MLGVVLGILAIALASFGLGWKAGARKYRREVEFLLDAAKQQYANLEVGPEAFMTYEAGDSAKVD